LPATVRYCPVFSTEEGVVSADERRLTQMGAA
jgi:hypothetical protein